jgi:UDP-N-acetylmuramoylalanine--D-glutamate ligase
MNARVGIIENSGTMAEAVAAAANISESGDVVILSPGCASFDMFKNYQDRGEQFSAAARAII